MWHSQRKLWWMNGHKQNECLANRLADLIPNSTPNDFRYTPQESSKLKKLSSHLSQDPIVWNLAYLQPWETPLRLSLIKSAVLTNLRGIPSAFINDNESGLPNLSTIVVNYLFIFFSLLKFLMLMLLLCYLNRSVRHTVEVPAAGPGSTTTYERAAHCHWAFKDDSMTHFNSSEKFTKPWSTILILRHIRHTSCIIIVRSGVFIDYALFNFLREIKSCLHRSDDLLCHLTNFSPHKMLNFFFSKLKA